MKFTAGSVSVDLIEDGCRVCAKGAGFEPQSLQAWEAICASEHGTVIDVGAYSGIYSLIAAKHMCRVVAFEPMPRNAQRFRDNAAANGVEKWIQLLQAAASDRSGEADIVFNGRMKGLTSGASLMAVRGDRASVETLPIDILGLDGVTAIKIDVERGEAKVLAGARETIERCKPVVLLEVLDAECAKAIRRALPGYVVTDQLDDRNWLLKPC